MSKKQHLWDEENLSNRHVESGGIDNGACLNRHVAEIKKNNSCSYRWQGYERAKEDPIKYNYPRYKALVQKQKKIQTDARTDKKGNKFPPWYEWELDPPTSFKKGDLDKGDWDLDHKHPVYGGNFQVKCYRPYWHEMHHIVPNSTLQKAIAGVGVGAKSPGRVVLVIRGRLLEAKYNLNHKVNMIMLPMDTEVASALRLPKHRKTVFLRSHGAYSRHVKDRLDEIFGSLKESTQTCTEKKYKNCKEQLEKLSEELYSQIITAGEQDLAPSLDDIKVQRFQKSVGPTSPMIGGRP